MGKAKRARTAETPKQPSLCLRLRAPYFYPDHHYFEDFAIENRSKAVRRWDARWDSLFLLRAFVEEGEETRHGKPHRRADETGKS
jgi:hypothetical protein